ncbi:MAG: alkaline phosphatase family protein [Actinobacteria bacterium]|nr:alkaline phosphatase family protein [Actinomycetota bacterium]
MLTVATLVAGACSAATGASGGSPSSPAAATTSSVSAAAPTSPTQTLVQVTGQGAAALVKAACANDTHEVLLRTWHGIMPGRSGDISMIPKFPNFVNSGLSHATPYDYTQNVPIFIYGPGFVRPGVYTKPVYLTDIAPTEGALLKFPFNAPDGSAQTQALLPASQRPLPRLVVTLVWDSGGNDVLDTWQQDTPYLNSLRSRGAWFTHASVGASPSNTPPGHSEIGTGAFPMHNGFVDDFVRIGDRIAQPTDMGPGLLVLPTLGDLYDRAMHNRPLVGIVATLSSHVMMMSHGSFWQGGDRDLALTRQFGGAVTSGLEAPKWVLSQSLRPYYTFPAYANSLPPLSSYTRQIDALDGKLDGLWRGSSIQQLKGGFDTPARTPFQTKLVETVIQREGFGKDAVPDLLYLNYKAIDTIGHLFSLNSPEMSDTVSIQDQALRQLVGFLNQTVGAGKWVMTLTADHGTQYSPAVSGAFLIDVGRLEKAINAQFDHDGDKIPLIEKLRPTQIWLDPQELARNHVTAVDISHFILGLTQAQTIASGSVPNPATAGDPVFASVLPTAMFSQLPCLPEAQQAP